MQKQKPIYFHPSVQLGAEGGSNGYWNWNGVIDALVGTGYRRGLRTWTREKLDAFFIALESKNPNQLRFEFKSQRGFSTSINSLDKVPVYQRLLVTIDLSNGLGYYNFEVQATDPRS